jgi:glycosidase
MEYFKKEFVTYTDPEITELYFGCLPSEGRYFVKKCKKISDGLFVADVSVPKGDLYYHFKEHINGLDIFLDPNNTQIGAKNWHSICRIGTIANNSLEFNLSSRFIRNLSKDLLELRIICHHKSILKLSIIIIENDGGMLEYPTECTYKYSNHKYCKLEMGKSLLIGKGFLIKIYFKDSYIYYNSLNKYDTNLGNEFIIVSVNDFPTNFVENTYQIFPDSFNKCRDLALMTEKHIIPSNEHLLNDSDFYGGNIRGIIEKVPYLFDMGIEAVYVTPIFLSNSNHRYDCIDYKVIDPLVGTREELKRLVNLLHERDMKIILDIVLNHCGLDFWMFSDVLENQENSIYCDMFDIASFPVSVNEELGFGYYGWWGNCKMPQFNLQNSKTKNFLFDICRYWIKEFDIDGWRIDVSSELPHSFLKEFKSCMQNEKKSIIVIGENWKNSYSFLENNDELDGVTNYLLWWKAFDPYFCAKTIDIAKFFDEIFYCYYLYPHDRIINSWNILSSHDIPRFYFKLSNKDDIYNAVFLQVFLPGIPIVYYGEEIGMEGDDTPYNRKYMEWARAEDSDIVTVYRNLLNIRKNSKALKYGNLSIVYLDSSQKMAVLKRVYERHVVYGICNFSDIFVELYVDKINDCRFKDFIYGKKIKLQKKAFLLIGDDIQSYGKNDYSYRV